MGDVSNLLLTCNGTWRMPMNSWPEPVTPPRTF
jgi:hypothetical protein